MGNTDEDVPPLVRYLDELRGEQSIRAFAESKGIDHNAIHRWRTGDKPKIDGLRRVADALEMPLGDILIIAGYATPDDFDGTKPRPAKAPSLADAIEYDPTLSPDTRQMLRLFLGQVSEVASKDGRTGKGRKRTVRTEQ